MQLPFAKIPDAIQIDENPSQTKIGNTLQLCKSAIVRTSQLNNTKGQDNKARQLECTLCHSCSKCTRFQPICTCMSTSWCRPCKWQAASAMSEIMPLILANTSALAPPSFPERLRATGRSCRSCATHRLVRAVRLTDDLVDAAGIQSMVDRQSDSQSGPLFPCQLAGGNSRCCFTPSHVAAWHNVGPRVMVITCLMFNMAHATLAVLD